jgi:DNA-binding transcriptional MerR regulator
MKAYSQDLRERVLRAVDRGRPRVEIVQMLGVSLATIKRYLKQRREEGHVRPKAIPGRPPKKRAQVEANVLPQLQAHDDATLEQHCAHVGANSRRMREPLDDEPGDQTTGLDAKKSRSGRQSATRRSGPPGERTRASFRRKRWCFLMSVAPTSL